MKEIGFPAGDERSASRGLLSRVAPAYQAGSTVALRSGFIEVFAARALPHPVAADVGAGR